MSLTASSSFRRSGQRDDRRRRLLTDDLSSAGDSDADWDAPEAAWPTFKSEHYGEAAFLEKQLRLADMIPRRLLGLAALVVVALAIIVGIEAAYARMIERAGSGALVGALDLASRGSLGCWFSSLLLVAASVAAGLIYSVRRHRADDYQGRYRVWLWVAGGLFLSAADQATNLRDAFRDFMIAVTGTPLAGDGAIWWMMVGAVLVVAIGSRMVIDIRGCRFALAALAAALLAHGVAFAGRYGITLADEASRQVMFVAGAEMVGNLLMLATMSLYARYVLLDAEGLLPHRETKATDTAETDEAETDEPARAVVAPAAAATAVADAATWREIDTPHPTPPSAHQRMTPSAPSAAPLAASVASGSGHKLSKAERKALKERLLRERQARQR